MLQQSTIEVVYTGTGFDTSVSGDGSDSDNHELTSISSTNLYNCKYIKIKIIALCVAAIGNNNSSASASNSIQIQTQDLTNLTYSDTLPSTVIQTIGTESNANNGQRDTYLQEITWLHELSSDEKSNGVQVKILTSSSASGNEYGGGCSITNKQTTIERIHG